MEFLPPAENPFPANNRKILISKATRISTDVNKPDFEAFFDGLTRQTKTFSINFILVTLVSHYSRKVIYITLQLLEVVMLNSIRHVAGIQTWDGRIKRVSNCSALTQTSIT